MQELSQLGADMQKMEGTVLIEQPNPSAMKWPIYVMPQTRTAIEQRYAGRLWSTLGIFMDCLADGSVTMITGEDAVKLKKLGITASAQMVAAVESAKSIEKERDQAVQDLFRLQQLLKDAGI